jgi:ABC-type phosphate/phosphonate transport system substrate-binding protein
VKALACLPMYDWPEERESVDAFWTYLWRRSGLMLPGRLTRPADEAELFGLWRDPALIFAQACWGPLSLGLLPGLRVLAQPDYSDVPGGRGPFYRSVLVAREGEAVPAPDAPGAAIPPDIGSVGRLAVNARHSLSGWLALLEDAHALRERAERAPVSPPAGEAVEENPLRLVETGGHRASIRAVAEGRADLAAIDCRTWALALRHEPCARRLVVVGWTAERLGLPYVTGAATDDKTAERLRETLIGMGCHPTQARDA